MVVSNVVTLSTRELCPLRSSAISCLCWSTRACSLMTSTSNVKGSRTYIKSSNVEQLQVCYVSLSSSSSCGRSGSVVIEGEGEN